MRPAGMVLRISVQEAFVAPEGLAELGSHNAGCHCIDLDVIRSQFHRQNLGQHFEPGFCNAVNPMPLAAFLAAMDEMLMIFPAPAFS